MVTLYQTRYTGWTVEAFPRTLARRARRHAVLYLDEEDPAGRRTRGPGVPDAGLTARSGPVNPCLG